MTVCPNFKHSAGILIKLMKRAPIWFNHIAFIKLRMVHAIRLFSIECSNGVVYKVRLLNSEMLIIDACFSFWIHD